MVFELFVYIELSGFQASELRYNELVTQVPESTRPLLRQIEAMQVENFCFSFIAFAALVKRILMQRIHLSN